MYGDTVKVTGPNNYSATLTADDFDAESGSLKITDLIDMISCRHGGASIAELSGTYLGHLTKWVMRIFSVVLLGVVVCPITSGDTAFRSAHLILAEIFRLDQKNIKNRLIITIPLLVVGGLLT